MPYPLKDMSGGRLKSWPGGGIHYPNRGYVPVFRMAEPEEKPVATVLPGPDALVYCKYCYGDVAPLVLREEVIPGRVTEMTLCSECACGLTPSREVG